MLLYICVFYCHCIPVYRLLPFPFVVHYNLFAPLTLLPYIAGGTVIDTFCYLVPSWAPTSIYFPFVYFTFVVACGGWDFWDCFVYYSIPL